MTDTVWKFTLDKSVNPINLPAGAQVLTVANQYDRITMWVRVNADAPASESRTFYPVATGAPIPTAATAYLGSVLLHGHTFVMHVFEGLPAPASQEGGNRG